MEKVKEPDPDNRIVPFIGYCPVCDTWTAEYHLHEMKREELVKP